MRIIRFVGLFCFFALYAKAQKYNFVNWTVEDGLIQSQASCICQDRYSQLWIGTQGGICKFDGKKFTGYSVQEGLTSNHVNVITCDNQGNLWIGTNNGISVFNGLNFKNIKLNPKGANNVRAVFVGSDSSVYALNNLRAYQIINYKAQKIYFTNDTTERVTCLRSNGSKLMAWVYDKGLYQYDGNKKGIKLAGPPKLPGAFAFDIKITRKQDTLLVMNGSLYRISKGETSEYELPLYNKKKINLICINEDTNGTLWFGSDNGTFRLNKDRLEHFSGKSGLSDNSVNSIFPDNENNLWFATDADGIFKFRENTFMYFDRSSGLSNPIVMGVTQTSDGTIYAGGYGGGLFKITNNSSVQAVNNKGPLLADVKIYALHADKQDNVWIGTINKGIWKYHAKSGAQQITGGTNGELMPGANVFYKDAQGNLLIGTNFGLYVYTNSGEVKTVKLNENVAITAIVPFGPDSVMVGTSKGLYFVNNNYGARLVNHPQFNSTYLLCLAKRNNNVWIGTTEKGILNWNYLTGQIINYTTANGLPSNFIYSIYISSVGQAWAGTGYGISHLKFNTQQQITGIKNYGRSDGLLGMECSHNCLLYARDSSLWFGTTKGLFHFNPKNNINETAAPVIHLKSVKLFSSDITDSSLFKGREAWFNVPQELTLGPSQNHITFELGAIYFTNPDDVLYNYKLEGIDNDSATTGNPVIIYPALPPGKYTLRVNGITKNGLASANQVFYSFEIKKAFYQTSIFQLVVVLSLLATGGLIAWLVTRVRQKRKQRAKELLEQIREEEFMKLRQRTAEDFHDEMGNNLTRISILTDVLKSKINAGTESEIGKLVQQIKENTVSLYNGSRDIIWSLNSQNDGLYEITEHLREIGVEMFNETAVDFNYRHNISNSPALKLKMDYSRNLIMIFKEAYSNIVKYSGAGKVDVELELNQPNKLNLVLKDNGKGFNPAEVSRGNGLKNIENRVKRMNGTIAIKSAPGQGTEIGIQIFI